MEVESEDTIGTVKGKISAEKGLPVESLKLVHKGNQGKDESTLESMGVKDGDFMVVMVLKVFPS